MATTVINLVGGSGLGKSTTASGLFYHMKLQGKDVEQVNEFAKRMVWSGQQITPLNQLYVLGQQTNSESMLYNKVDYVITDSPLLLAGVYDIYYNNRHSTLDTIIDFIKRSDIQHKYYLLKRNKPFNPKGRYENETQAKEVDKLTKDVLDSLKLDYMYLDCPDEARVDVILKELNNG